MCVLVTVYEVCYDSSCNFSGVGVFEEFAVGAALAGGFVADGVHLEKEG